MRSHILRPLFGAVQQWVPEYGLPVVGDGGGPVNDLRSAARDALAILDPGACNPRGVARALVEAVDLARATMAPLYGIEYAPARLIMSQLGSLLGHSDGDYRRRSDDLDFCKSLSVA